MRFDVLIRGGQVVDGTGALPVRADVGFERDRVTAVGDLSTADGTVVVDAVDHYVTPGFIDVHAHSDLVAFFEPALTDVAAAAVRQGVTVEVAGNCGASPWPPRRGGGNDPYLQAMPASARRSFESLAQFRETANAEKSLFAHLAPLLGHGSLRSSVLGEENRPPTDDEMRRMEDAVALAMDEGAFGISSGLIYAPGLYATTEELVRLAAVAAGYGRPYTSHMRDEGDRVVEALDETLEIGRRSGAAVQVSHHKLSGRRNWGRSDQTLARMDQARATGQDVLIDVYPYTAGSTLLAAMLPPWALDGGLPTVLDVLRSGRDRLRAEYALERSTWQNFPSLVGWAGIVVVGTSEIAGKSIADLAAENGIHPVDAFADTLLADPGSLCLVHAMDAAEVETLGDQPFALVGSDGVPLPGRQHPRLAGAFARMLARHAGDPKRFADLVHRASALPAQRFGLVSRGELHPGAYADVVVIDPVRVCDRATYDEPLLPPDGIPHVFVSGDHVVRDGALTGARPGRVLAAG